MPIISLIVPAYNAAGFLDATLRSVSRQSMADFECLVIDDLSDDDTLTIADDWRGRDRRIRVIPQHARSGVSAARNAGIRSAMGPFCAFLDADDLLMPDSLALRFRAWQRAARDAGADRWRLAGSYCASQTIPEHQDNPPISRPAEVAPASFVGNGGACPFNANQPLVRRDILREMGGFCESMAQAEDYDLWARILRAGYWFAAAPHVAATYRSRQGSAVRRMPLGHLRTALALHDSAALPLAGSVLTRSPGRMRKPHDHYRRQADKTRRILEFAGMALAGEGPDSGEIADLIAVHLPDLPVVLAPGTDAAELLAAGVRRQTGSEPTAVQRQRIDALLGEVRSRPQGDDTPAATPFGPYGREGPDRLWHPARQAEFDVIFVPHKAYHVWTIGLAAEALRAAGIRFTIAEIAPQWREGGVRARALEMGLPILTWGEVALGAFAPRLVVALNDWDYVTRPILVAAEEAGIATAAIVEGIQDYADADTGRQRHAYRTAQTVLLPGEFDRRYFPGAGSQTLHVVGVPRVQHLRRERARLGQPPAGRSSRRVLINSNFSHNVMTDRRDGWLTAAVRAVQAAGMVPVISRHPEDRGVLFPEHVTDASFYDAVAGCCVSVQRFASGILESLADGIPVIYFNPHGETVDKFASDPMGAYPIATSGDALLDLLRRLPDWGDAALAAADAFLDTHAGAMDLDSGAAIAAALSSAMGPRPSAEMQERFRDNLGLIDRHTASLTRRVMLFETPATAVADLRGLKAAEPDAVAALAEAADLASDGAAAAVLRGGLAWRGRVRLHRLLARGFRATARWPRIERAARKAGEYYMRHLSPH